MIYIFAMEVSHAVIQIVLLTDSFRGGPTHDRVEDWLGSNSGSNDSSSNNSIEILVHAVLIFFIIFAVIAVFMIGQLLWFHVSLHRQQLTTYEYVVRDHRRKKEERQRSEELAHQRVVAVAKARREQQQHGCCWGGALHLRAGGWCRQVCGSSGGVCVEACDPLDMPAPPDPEAGFAAALGGGVPVPKKSNGERRGEENSVGEERPPPVQGMNEEETSKKM